MTVVRFHFNSSLSPQALSKALTDFGPTRPDMWPTTDADTFQVHQLGDRWAEVTEGNSSAWEHARYEWDPNGNRVVITTLDSKLFGPGGGWIFRFTPDGAVTRVDVELTRHPHNLKGKLLAALLPIAAPGALKKSFSGPLHAI